MLDQWNRLEMSEMDPHTFGQLIYDEGTKVIQRGKCSIFNEWCGVVYLMNVVFLTNGVQLMNWTCL